MKTETLIRIKGSWSGIYGWGTGYYDKEKYLNWENFWDNINAIYWNSVIANDTFNTRYLVTTSGSIYLHPMDFTTVLKSSGVVCNGKHFDGEVRELKELCEKAAKVCGGTFTMEVSEEKEVSFS